MAKIAVFNLKNDSTQHLSFKYVYFDVKREHLPQSSRIIRGFSTFPYISSQYKFKIPERSHSLYMVKILTESLKTENDIFCSEIGSGFGAPNGQKKKKTNKQQQQQQQQKMDEDEVA